MTWDYDAWLQDNDAYMRFSGLDNEGSDDEDLDDDDLEEEYEDEDD